MAYPPTVPPNNRTDATPQATNHPNDHNQVSNALRDIINELGNNPSGPKGTVQQRVTVLEDNALMKAGGSMTGNIDMNQHDIFDLPDPPGPNGAVPKTYCDKKVQVAGDVMNGNLQAGGYPLGGSPLAGILLDVEGRLIVLSGTASAGLPTMTLNRQSSADANGEIYTRYQSSGTQIGSVTRASASSVAFNTSSDPRLKEVVGPITDALARAKQLGDNAFRGRWIADDGAGDEWDMVNAPDVDVVAPYASNGAPDQVDGDGNIMPMSIDYGSLVPLLFAAVAELSARVEALEQP